MGVPGNILHPPWQGFGSSNQQFHSKFKYQYTLSLETSSLAMGLIIFGTGFHAIINYLLTGYYVTYVKLFSPAIPDNKLDTCILVPYFLHCITITSLYHINALCHYQYFNNFSNPFWIIRFLNFN